MAIYHFSGTIISRSSGKSSVVSAAYRSGEKLYDERQERMADYSRKQDVVHEEIILPEGAPEWMGVREKLWNVVEAAENRKDAQLAREVHFSLPREFTKEQNIELAREFVRDEFVYTTNNQIVAKGDFDGHAENMLFPVEFYPVLQSFSPTKYAITESWVFFKSDESVIGVRQLEPTGLSDSIIRIFDKINEEKADLPEEFKDIVEESGVFVDTEMGSDSIIFSFKDGEMILSSNNSKGEISKSIPFEKEMEGFILSQKYLKAVAPISSEFCNEKEVVYFFGDWVTVAVAKIQE